MKDSPACMKIESPFEELTWEAASWPDPCTVLGSAMSCSSQYTSRRPE